MKMNNVLFILTVTVLPLLIISCTGGSTEIGNAHSMIIGSITDNSIGAYTVPVQLVKEQFVPGNNTTGEVFTEYTDYKGIYIFQDIPSGLYYLNSKNTRKCIIKGPFEIREENMQLPDVALLPAGKVTLHIDDSDSVNAVYILGLAELYSVVDGIVELNTVPQGTVTIIGYSTSKGTPSIITTGNSQQITVTVSEGDSVVTSFTNNAPRITTNVTFMSHAIKIDSVHYSLDLDAFDPENDDIRFDIVHAPYGVKIDTLSGVIGWHPEKTIAPGNYEICVAVTDVRGASSRVWWNVAAAQNFFTLDDTPMKITAVTGSTYIAIAGIIDTSGINRYRFAWGDGDTTHWQNMPEAAHVWQKQGDFFITYQMQYGIDSSFSEWIGKTTARVSDITPPVITLHGDDTLRLAVKQNIEDFIDNYTEPGYTAFDNVDGDITENVTVSEVTYMNQAFYYIAYNVQDGAGNEQSVRRMIKTDTVLCAPIISLVNGDSMIQRVNTPWIEPGFIVTDAQDWIIPASEVIVDSADLVANLGNPNTYTVTYTATNSAGLTTTVKRIVWITADNDIIPPVITLLGPNPDSVIINSIEYIEPGFTAIDNMGGNLTDLVIRTGSVNLKQISMNSLIYSVTDTMGTISRIQRIVWIVADTALIDTTD